MEGDRSKRADRTFPIWFQDTSWKRNSARMIRHHHKTNSMPRHHEVSNESMVTEVYLHRHAIMDVKSSSVRSSTLPCLCSSIQQLGSTRASTNSQHYHYWRSQSDVNFYRETSALLPYSFVSIEHQVGYFLSSKHQISYES